MRRGLLFSLGVAAMLAAASAWTDRPVQAVAAVNGTSEMVGVRGTTTRETTATANRGVAAPDAGRGHGLEDAKRDIFALRSDPMPSQPPPVVRQVTPTVPSSAGNPGPAPRTVIAAAAPSIGLRFVGRMAPVEGGPLFYMARGASEFAVVAGQKVDEGYTVMSVSDEAVTLVHEITGTTATVPIPRD